MSPGDLLVPLTLGLVGSLHCVQMCGPIALASGMAPPGTAPIRRLGGVSAYNLGRITTYALLGALAGLTGTGLNLVGRLGGFRNSAALVAGALLVAGGLLTLLGPGLSLFKSWTVPARVGRLLRTGSIRNRYLLGLALGLLPCGLVYGALLKALESAGPLSGAVTMAVFGLGTAPPLVAIGAFSSVLGRRLNRHAMVLSGLALASTGLFLVWRGLQPTAAGCCH